MTKDDIPQRSADASREQRKGPSPTITKVDSGLSLWRSAKASSARKRSFSAVRRDTVRTRRHSPTPRLDIVGREVSVTGTGTTDIWIPSANFCSLKFFLIRLDTTRTCRARAIIKRARKERKRFLMLNRINSGS